jgi:hypothetical protein
MEGDEYRQELAPLRTELCTPLILAGAGVSVDPPSGAPTGLALTDQLLTQLAPDDISLRLLRQYAFPTRFFPSKRQAFLRFEHIVQTLQDAVDPTMTLLTTIFDELPPNDCHRSLASLIERGWPVVTTNFDGCIETALGPTQYVHEVASLTSWQEDPGARRLPMLGKLHGSLRDREGRVIGHTVRATVPAVLGGHAFRTLEAENAGAALTFLQAALSARSLIVVGYSGLDDFDIVPILRECGYPHRVVWISHREASSVRIERLDDWQRRLALAGCFLAREEELLYSLALTAGNPANVIRLLGPSRDILRELADPGRDSRPTAGKPTATAQAPRRDVRLGSIQRWLAAAVLFRRVDDVPAMIRCYRKQLTEDDADPLTRHRAFYNLAEAHLRLDQLTEAVGAATEARKLSVELADPWRSDLTTLLYARVLSFGQAAERKTSVSFFAEVARNCFDYVMAREGLEVSPDEWRRCVERREAYEYAELNRLDQSVWAGYLPPREAFVQSAPLRQMLMVSRNVAVECQLDAAQVTWAASDAGRATEEHWTQMQMIERRVADLHLPPGLLADYVRRLRRS